MEVDDRVVDDSHELIDLKELSRMLNRSYNTTKVEVTRDPDKLPPRVRLPGSRRVLFKKSTVRDWIDSHIEGLQNEQVS